MDEEQRKPYDDLFEEISVATAASISGAALILHNGMGKEANDFIIKSKVYAAASKRYLMDHIEDLTTISKDNFDKAIEDAKVSYAQLSEVGYNFRSSDTMAIDGLFSLYQAELNPNKILRTAYDSDLRDVMKASVDSIDNLPEEVRSAFLSNSGTFVHNSSTPKDIHAQLIKKLGKENFIASTDAINKVIEDIEDWKRQWTFDDGKGTWVTQKGNQVLRDYKTKIADWNRVLELQNEGKKKPEYKIFKQLNPDKNLTIGELLDIEAGEDSQNKDTIRKIFSKDRILTLNSYDIDKIVTPRTRLSAELKSRIPKDGKNTSFSALDLIKAQYSKLSEEDKKVLRQLELVNLFKGQKGEIYTLDEVKGIGGALMDLMANIFPFSMTRAGDIRAQRFADTSVMMFKAGELNPVLAHYTGGKDYLQETVYKVYDKFYRFDKDNNAVEIQELRGSKVFSTKVGVVKEVLQAQMDGIARTPDDKKSYLERKLNFEFEAVQELKEENGNNSRLFSSFGQEQISYMRSLESAARIGGIEEYTDFTNLGNRANKFEKFLRKTTYGFNRDSARRLYNAVSPNDDSRRFLDYIIRLEEHPESLNDIMDELAKVEDSNITYKNSDLSKSIRKYINDPDSVRQLFSSTLKDPYARKEGHYISLDFAGELKKQLSNEFLSRYEDNNSYRSVTELIENNLHGMNKKQALGLAAVQKYLNYLGFPYEKEINDEVEEKLNIQKIIDKLEELTNDNSDEANMLKMQLQWHVDNSADKYRDTLKREAKDQISQNIPDYVVLKPAVGARRTALNIISDINQGEVDKAVNSGKKFINQFLAGAGDPENFTSLSIASNFLLQRVNGELDIGFRPWFFKKSFFNLDLRLKGKDTRTTKALLKGFAIKRIGAAYGIYKGLDFLDDMTKVATGMGLVETGVSGAANAYLGIKKFTGAIGADEDLKSISSDNAILNYFGEYTGEIGGEWNTYDEQVDYYRNGYTPIRKARFWSWGSSNEFRGGRISYFEPTMLRTLASDYKDKSLYNGSYWNKWNPLNILDPYYLEDLHSEDRPYPVSGSLFEENTPWGVILNPTVGEILKPKIYLHRDRLQDGVDVKALIYQMNKNIKDRAAENNNLFYVQNGKLRSMDFMAYNAPEYSSRILTLNESDQQGYVSDYGRYNTPVAINDGLYQEIVRENQKFVDQNKKLTLKDKIAIESAEGNKAAQIVNTFTGSSSLNILREENQKILAKAGYDKSQGIMIENKLSATVDPVDQMLDNSEEISELMQTGSANDYVHEMAVSARMITGLYGWGISNVLDVGQNNQDRIATAADMYSSSRAFWDMNLGGAGGSFMEIGRRFIPEYRRFQTKNPLMNTMPDWIPDRLKFGDAFTEIPNGEARLPGLGYESLNKLHPDVYGSYGAYDRFKILADVAPYSPEYKFWKNIASKTVADPYLRKDMEKIKERVKLQSKQHDFQEYKYVDRDVDRRSAYITEIGKNGTFKIYGSDETYKLAGAKINANQNESQEQVLARYIQPGQLVSIMIDKNDAYARNKDVNRSINAAVLIDGENVSMQMIKNGDASKRQSDVSAAAYMANHGDTVNTINWLSEKFMHADIPIFHNRWFRANSALEDYQDDYLYGTSFQSWDDFWQTFIMPNARKEAASTFWTGTAIAVDILRNNIIDDTEGNSGDKNLLSNLYKKYVNQDGPLGKYQKVGKFLNNNETQRFIRQGSYLLDRGGLAGYFVGKVAKLGRSEAARLSNTTFRRAGSALNLAFSAIAAPENVGVSTMTWSRLAYLASNEFFGGKSRGIAAAAGAIVGLARWAGSKHLLSDDPYDTQYIPDSAKTRWEMQDYFDRLTYLKYMALYEKAADKAKSKEDTDIRAILERQDEEAKNIKETKLEISEALDKLAGVDTSEAAQMRGLLSERVKNLTPSKIPLSGGEYTKSAIIYYNAAKSTMYALDETSSMADVIRALPKTDREYFMEFLKERDEDKRREILSYVSPQIRKALNMFWYKKYDKPISNEEFFAKHAMPGPLWSGWNPNIDLADVQAKVIKNEGMNYSDFGVYASQYREPEVINAPSIEYSSHDSLLEAEIKIKTLLSGLGLTGVNVSVDKGQDDTIQVLANVARVTEYKLGETISNIFEGI